MSEYLFSIKTPNVSNPPPYDNSINPNQCVNGSPISKYSNYGTNNADVLYSIWCANQNTLGAQFTKSQTQNLAPGPNPTCSGPSNIFIIRHAEKSSVLPNYGINNNGAYRSSQLIGFVNELADQGYPISYLISCNPCPFNVPDPSMRNIQTITMVSFMLNIPMLIYDTSQSYSSVCEALFPQSVTPGTIGAFDGLNVLICWEHSTIQSLCIALLQTMGPLNRINTTPINYSGIDNYADPFFENLNPCPDGNFLCNDSTNSFYIPPNTNPGSTVAPIGPNSQTYPYWSNYNFDSVFGFQVKNQVLILIFRFLSSLVIHVTQVVG